MVKLLILLYPLLLFAVTVSLETSQKSYICGESGTITIKVEGAKLSEVNFPSLRWFDGQFILDRGNVAQEGNIVSKTFEFVATNTFTIPKLAVKVKGKTYYTKPRTIEVALSPIVEGKVACYSFYSTKKLIQHFPFRLTLYCIAKDPQLKVDNIAPPVLWNFDLIKEESTTRTIELDRNLSFRRFILAPYKNKENIIPNTVAHIIYKDNEYYVPILTYKELSTTPLPTGVYMVGSYKIAAKPISKERIELSIEGLGSCDEIDPFELHIDNVTTIAESPKTKIVRLPKDDLCFIHFRQTFYIRTDHNITIPPFTFRYFDYRKKRVQTIATQPIQFTANFHPPKPQPQKSKQKSSSSLTFKEVLLIILFTLFGALLLYSILIRSQIEQLLPANFRTADDKALYDLLIRYGKNSQIDRYLLELEERIYRNSSKPIPRKKILQLLRKDIVGEQLLRRLTIVHVLMALVALSIIGALWL